jgi:glycosyltransferase involved in cell wall biosynthesis
MKIIILGSQSFIDFGPKIGSQFIAEGLAALGCQVDYISSLSSPLDFLFSLRRQRFYDSWIGRQNAGYKISRNLTEYRLKCLYPAHRYTLVTRFQGELFGCLIPKIVRDKNYDACITDACPNALILPTIKANKRFLRLNDWPRGFSSEMSRIAIEFFEGLVSDSRTNEIWAVSRSLVTWASRLPNAATTVYLPNGIEENLFTEAALPGKKRVRTAIFVGGNTPWLDTGLLNSVASRLPDWEIDVCGVFPKSLKTRYRNLRFIGPIPHSRLPTTLRSYEVGLIPYKDTDKRFQFVERPLKFLEYLSCDLGIASTDVGRLRSGMGSLANYGNGAADFSAAILSAQANRRLRDTNEIRALLASNTWTRISSTILSRMNSNV